MKDNECKEVYKLFNKKMRELGFVKENKYTFTTILKHNIIVVLRLDPMEDRINNSPTEMRARCSSNIPWLFESTGGYLWSSDLEPLENGRDMYNVLYRMKYSNETEYEEVLNRIHEIMKSKIISPLEQIEDLNNLKRILTQSRFDNEISKNYLDVILNLYFKNRERAINLYHEAIKNYEKNFEAIPQEDREFIQELYNYESLSRMLELDDYELENFFKERTMQRLLRDYPRLYKKMEKQ